MWTSVKGDDDENVLVEDSDRNSSDAEVSDLTFARKHGVSGYAVRNLIKLSSILTLTSQLRSIELVQHVGCDQVTDRTLQRLVLSLKLIEIKVKR